MPSSTPLESSIIDHRAFSRFICCQGLYRIFHYVAGEKCYAAAARKKNCRGEEQVDRAATWLKWKEAAKGDQLIRSSATELLRLMRQGKVLVLVVTAFCARAAQVQDVLNCGTEYCLLKL